MSDRERFGALRALLAGPPCVWRWEVLCLRVDELERSLAHTRQLRDMYLPYLEGVLRAWPDDLRVAPPRWARRAICGEPTPQLHLCRVLGDLIELFDATLASECLRGLRASRDLTAIHTLRMGSVGGDALPALLASGALPNLRNLSLRGGSAPSDAPIETLARLESICFDTMSLGEVRAWLACAPAGFPALHTLGILCAGRPEDWSPLAHTLQHTPTPALRTFVANRGGAGEVFASAQLAPPLEQLILYDCPAHTLRLIADGPLVHTLRALNLSFRGSETEEALGLPELVAAAPQRLESLTLRECRLPPDVGVSFLDEPPPALRRLALCDVTDTDGDAILQLASTPGLRALRLERVDRTCTTPLASPSLEHLHLSPRRIGEDVGLWAVDMCAPLRTLYIGAITATPSFLSTLLASPAADTLESLTLDMASIGPKGCTALAEAALPMLRTLAIKRDHPGSSGLESLLLADWFPSLQNLSLDGCGLNERALRLWADAPEARLEHLDLSWNTLGDPRDEVFAAFLASPALRHLRSLDVRRASDRLEAAWRGDVRDAWERTVAILDSPLGAQLWQLTSPMEYPGAGDASPGFVGALRALHCPDLARLEPGRFGERRSFGGSIASFDALHRALGEVSWLERHACMTDLRGARVAVHEQSARYLPMFMDEDPNAWIWLRPRTIF